ncbi:tyrosine-type recombinase/integrase [Seonamhaeicola maritimus]|uniref:Tyrosine-type recombinase/integrase n=1 Tax=Seonamhaeicola maritimus TaxID=2591822 RepID=A0A5C7GHV2_9FLAO|nr:phage integrase SAM-like domain-containing protein [Seonamhaeicola maritimus]TXG36989.1 tyrosine-type recombinase/integrase [Seonamhaeicola maritimus]
MATVKFLLQSKSDNAPIYLRLSVSRGLVFKRKTGLFINPKDWSYDKSLPKQTTNTNKNLSTDLQALSNEVVKRLNDANSKGISINGNWLQDAIDLHFKRITENKHSDLLTDAIQDIIDSAEVRINAKKELGLSKSRINAYKSLKSKIIEYQGKKIIKVREVNVKFANDFLMHLLKTKGYQKSTALKLIADLKTVCYDADINGIEVNKEVSKIKSAKTPNKNIIYLSYSELELIEKTKLVSEALQNARKWLLLGCNIGQRVSDLLMINESNFVTINGLDVIELTQQKTGKKVTIPLLDKTKEILETGLPYKISSQKFNKYIKEICKLAEIKDMVKGKKLEVLEKGKGNKLKRKIEGVYPKYELVGSHVCRRSFATNLYGTLPTALIMRITAHSTEKMLLNYIGKESSDYAQQIADFYTLQAQKGKKESNLKVVKNVSN